MYLAFRSPAVDAANYVRIKPVLAIYEYILAWLRASLSLQAERTVV
jgi:hypothetical protein